MVFKITTDEAGELPIELVYNFTIKRIYFSFNRPKVPWRRFQSLDYLASLLTYTSKIFSLFYWEHYYKKPSNLTTLKAYITPDPLFWRKGKGKARFLINFIYLFIHLFIYLFIL